MPTRERSSGSTESRSSVVDLAAYRARSERNESRRSGSHGGVVDDRVVDDTTMDVLALYQYLQRFGYSPDADLARRHPAGRSRVARAAAEALTPEVATVATVRPFRKAAGLELPTSSVSQVGD